jgi:septal ring factor EnvC (AmiA/AmiB activator)
VYFIAYLFRLVVYLIFSYVCCVCIAQAELADVKSVQVPAIEAQHKDAMAKLSSEVSRLKHACKEAEAAAAAARAEAADASTQSTLQAQLHEAVRDRERWVSRSPSCKGSHRSRGCVWGGG